MSPEPSLTEKEYAEPLAIQFSVFLANRVGALQDLLALFAENGVVLHGFTITDASEWSVVRVVCADPDKARALLKAQGLGFTENEVLLIELPRVGQLSRMCTLLVQAELNINFAYSLMVRGRQYPVVVLHVDDLSLAASLLLRHQFVLLGAADLVDPT